MSAEFDTSRQAEARRRSLLEAHFYPGRVEPYIVADGWRFGSSRLQSEFKIDAVGRFKGHCVCIEEKFDTHSKTGNLCLETHSHLENSPETLAGDGWMSKYGDGRPVCRADWLVYAFVESDARLTVWVYHLPRLRDWFLGNLDNYPFSDKPNPGYTTRSRIVPLANVPKNCVIYESVAVPGTQILDDEWADPFPDWNP